MIDQVSTDARQVECDGHAGTFQLCSSSNTRVEQNPGRANGAACNNHFEVRADVAQRSIAHVTHAHCPMPLEQNTVYE